MAFKAGDVVRLADKGDPLNKPLRGKKRRLWKIEGVKLEERLNDKGEKVTVQVCIVESDDHKVSTNFDADKLVAA